MPKLVDVQARRRSLIHAAIETIGEQASAEVSVKQIADRAGMSPALAFHYFGDKDAIIFETMRHLMRELGSASAEKRRQAHTPYARLMATIETSFAPAQFSKAVVTAWLVFYLRAFSTTDCARLLSIYHRRLSSNLRHDLRPLCGAQQAHRLETGLSALIDGLYIRHGLSTAGPDPKAAIAICLDYLAHNLKAR